MIPEWSVRQYLDVEPNMLRAGVDWHRFNDNQRYAKVPQDRNIDLCCYAQDYRYFDHRREDIRHRLKLKSSFAAAVEDPFTEILSENLTSVHVRRTDYLRYPRHHPVLPLEYYREAVNVMGDTIFLVFSDDLEWCRNHMTWREFLFVENPDPVANLHLMSLCNNAIIANSSLSWWGAYQRQREGKVVAPERWFGDALHQVDTSHLKLPEWIQI
jgi:hypothetical protein